MTSGQMTLDDTELAQRSSKTGGVATPAPCGIFGGILNKNGRKYKNGGDHVKSTDNALDGVVVSVDRLEKSDGTMMNGNTKTAGRNTVSDPEKGLGRPSSLYSHGDKVS